MRRTREIVEDTAFDGRMRDKFTAMKVPRHYPFVLLVR
jgi:hypothetical protein